MSLSPAVPRDPIHARQIDCRGYRRSDGLWDIEGHLTDAKSYGFANAFRGEIAPGEPIHDMWLRLTLDNELTVIRAEAVTAAGPFAVCPAITPAFAKLEGLKIGPGWRRAVQARLGGVQGCTHLVELLGPLATTAYQTIHAWRARHEPEAASDRVPSLLDSCHALARDGEVVRTHFPRWYTGPELEPGAGTSAASCRFVGGQGRDREGVNVGLHQVAKRAEHHALPLDPALALECLRNDGELEVALAFRACPGVADVLRRLVNQREMAGRERGAQPLADRARNAHIIISARTAAKRLDLRIGRHQVWRRRTLWSRAEGGAVRRRDRFAQFRGFLLKCGLSSATAV